MKRYIHVTKEVRDNLAITYKTNKMTVWRALNYVNDSPMSKDIRQSAREQGGIDMIAIPAIQTFHDHDGYMRQYLPNSTMVECDLNTGCVDIIKEGKSVMHYDNVYMSDLTAIQEQASRL